MEWHVLLVFELILEVRMLIRKQFPDEGIKKPCFLSKQQPLDSSDVCYDVKYNQEDDVITITKTEEWPEVIVVSEMQRTSEQKPTRQLRRQQNVQESDYRKFNLVFFTLII